MSQAKKLLVLGYEFLEDRRGNRLPVSIHSTPEGFERKRLFTWCLTDGQGHRLPVLRRPVDSREEAERIADELRRRHGWRSSRHAGPRERSAGEVEPWE